MQTRRREARRWWLVVAISGLALGEGVLSQVTDSLRIDDNTITAGELSVTGAGLTIAAGYDGVCPSDLVYGTAAIPGIDLVVDVAEELPQGASIEVCVRNDGAVATVATLTLQLLADEEVGECTDSELAAGDGSCASGDAGELAGATIATRHSRCTDVETSEPLTALSTTNVGSLSPGAVCHASVYVEVDGDPAVLQTDALTFAIVIEGTPA